jgi:primosomal protein N' (replication factor Y)
MQHDLFPIETPTSTAGLFAEVVFDRPLDHPFSYAVRDALRGKIAVGSRVRVPFGRGDKSVVGYCVGLSETAPPRTVKEVREVLDEVPLLTENLLRLTRWMADYYLCGWGQVLNAVVPAGARNRAGTRSKIYVEAVPKAETPNPVSKLTPKQEAGLKHLRELARPVEMAAINRIAGVGATVIRALLDKRLIRRVVRRADRDLTSNEEVILEKPFILNSQQQQVWSKIEPALKKKEFKVFLLHGVTGSGKTEVYLRAIEEMIQQGREVLVLVPEISLTPQTIQRFRGRCGEVAVLHSHLADAERGGHWRRIFEGKVKVVVGARSAVFAPTRNLGLIVIDEEHESTFKQETTPRYHARDVAVMRARLEGIPILLGSATPSLESWQNAQRGQYTLLSLPERVLDRPMPPVGLIDMRHQPPARGRPAGISEPLAHAMRQALDDGGQVLLLLNRRGYSTHVHCPSCGHVETCKFCDLALTYHQDRDCMLCHYCGYEQAPLQQCPQCGKAAIRYQGLGTEKLEVEIQDRFPGVPMGRMDSDSMRGRGSHARVLGAFRRGDLRILMGTQMIAKGLDFPNVTLVGVVNADLGLHQPDFRSAERTFQLLSQVAGRAGRGPRGGRVLIQTFDPEHPSIARAAAHNYSGFVKEELAHRLAHRYPPFQRLARLILRCKDRQKGDDFAHRLADAFAQALKGNEKGMPHELRLLGPAEAPVFRLKGFYRFHFQLQSPSPGALHQLLRQVIPTVHPPTEVELTVDVDPFNML